MSALKVRAEAAVREGKQRRRESDKSRKMPTEPWVGGRLSIRTNNTKGPEKAGCTSVAPEG